jgi:hypothetical protein
MQPINRELLTRVSLTLLILLAGLAMVPFVDLPDTAVGWEALTGVYTPQLEVNESSGGPGSVFALTGTGYPPNSMATIYVEGQPAGTVMTDGAGMATFRINTLGLPLGLYNVTMEVDANASATQSFELEDNQEPVSPPPGFSGPTFYLGPVVYLPIVGRP